MPAPDWFHNAIRHAEGSSDTDVSPKGAQGRQQVMPATKRKPGFGILPARDNSIEESNRVGRDYADAMWDINKGDADLAAASYNAGPGAVSKYGGIPPYRETQNYVKRVNDFMSKGPALEMTPELEAKFKARHEAEQAPLEMTPELDAKFKARYAAENPEPTEEAPGRYGAAFERSKQGFGQTLEGIGLGASSALSGENTQKRMDELKASQAQEVAGPKSMSVQDLQDIYSKDGLLAAAKEIPGFAAEKFVESSTSSAAPLAAGLAAGAIFPPAAIPVTIATSIIQQFGEMIGRQAQEKVASGELDPSSAIIAAIPAGVLDAYADRFTFGLSSPAKKSIVDAAAGEIQKNLLARVGAHAVKGALVEAPTEMTQQALQRGQAGLPLWNEEAKSEYKEAGGAAAAAGSLQGGIGGIYRREAPEPILGEEQTPSTVEEPTIEPVQPANVVNLQRTRIAQEGEIAPTHAMEDSLNHDEVFIAEDGEPTTVGEYYDEQLQAFGEEAAAYEATYDALNKAKARTEAETKTADAVNSWDTSVTEQGTTVTPPKVSETEQKLPADEQDKELGNISAPIEEVKSPEVAPIEQVKAPEITPIELQTIKNLVSNWEKPGYKINLNSKGRIEQVKDLGLYVEGDTRADMIAKAKKIISEQEKVVTPLTKEELKEPKGKAIKFIKGVKPTAHPSVENYLNQNHYYGDAAPITTEQAVKNIPYEIAFDRYDTIKHEDSSTTGKEAKDSVFSTLDKLAVAATTAKNKVNAVEQAKIVKLAEKNNWSGELRKKELAPYKKVNYKAEAPLEFMSADEVAKIYEQYEGKRTNWTANNGGGPRARAVKDRAEFLKTLPPKQQADIQAKADKIFKESIKSAINRSKLEKGTRKSQVAVTDEEDTELEKAGDELVRQQYENKSKEIKDKWEETKLEDDLERARIKGGRPVTETKEKVTKAPTKRIVIENRVASALKTEIQLGGKSFTGLLDIINVDSKNKSLRAVANGLLEIVNDLPSIAQTDRPNSINFRFGEVKGANGEFNPATNTITIAGDKTGYTGDRPLEEVVLHEMLHYLTDHVVDNRAKFIDSIKNDTQKKRVIDGLERLDKNYKLAKKVLGKDYNIGNLKEFIAETFSNPVFQQALGDIKVDRSEDSLLHKIIKSIANALGFKNQTDGVVLKESLADIISLISEPTIGIRGKKTSQNLQAPRNIRDAELFDDATNNPLLNFTPDSTSYFKKLFGTVEGWNHVAHAFQNDRRWAKVWQDDVFLAGKLESDPNKDFNNTYDQLTLSQQKAINLRKEHLVQPIETLQNNVNKLTKMWGLKSVDETLNILGRARQGLNGQERRNTKYHITVPLLEDSDNKLVAGDGRPITPETRRHDILGSKENGYKGLLDDPNLTKKDAENLWDELKWLVENYADPAYANKNDSKYDTLGVTAVTEQNYVDAYESLPANQKALADEVFTSLKKLNDATRTMDEDSNYWSKPVDNWVNFYGWKHYSPFKGAPKHQKIDEFFDIDNFKSGKELQDFEGAWGGRTTESNNPILQTITDASRAADRAGRKDLTQSIKNASKKGKFNPNGAGLIDAKVIGKVKFEDRMSIREMSKENIILHYNKDGTIDIIEFEPTARKLLESIRRTYKPHNKFVDSLSVYTSVMGQMHTRYNFNFAPMNFVRDILTNAWVMGAELGPTKSLKLIGTVANKVIAQGGIFKALKLSNIYEHNGIEEIRRIRDTSSDPFMVNMCEYILQGGKVSYKASMSNKANQEGFTKVANSTFVGTSAKGFNKIIDTWNEMFEIASRSAAYGIYKDHYINSGMSKEAAGVKAAADTKNLANFEQVGEYGKTLGTLYMFARPSATGAVRAVEAIAPAFSSVESAIKRLPNSGAFAYTQTVGSPRIYTDPAAIEHYKKEYMKRSANARVMTASLIGAGMAIYYMSLSMADDDDKGRNKTATDNMDQWTKYARFHTKDENGKDVVHQMPWGFGLGAFLAAGAQMGAVLAGNMPLKEALWNMGTQISLDSFIPVPVSRMDFSETPLVAGLDSITPSLFRPALEFALNKNGLGQNISGASGGDAYSGSLKVPEIYKQASRYFANFSSDELGISPGTVNVSPSSLQFWAGSYVDGASRVAELATNIGLRVKGEKSENIKTDVPFIGSFYGTMSNVDAREFGKLEVKIKDIKDNLKMFENSPKDYENYVKHNPLAEDIVAVYNKYTGAALNKLYSEKKDYLQAPDITPIEREALVKPTEDEINLIKKELLDLYNADYRFTPD